MEFLAEDLNQACPDLMQIQLLCSKFCHFPNYTWVL